MSEKYKRVYHAWENWECYKAGFFNTDTTVEGLDSDDAGELYREFLSDLDAFEQGIKDVFRYWPNSCEQFLMNTSINRIAWLGQSAMCISTGIPSKFKFGFNLLNEEQKKLANSLAAKFLKEWLGERK
jgi:hypothetical protein